MNKLRKTDTVIICGLPMVEPLVQVYQHRYWSSQLLRIAMDFPYWRCNLKKIEYETIQNIASF